MSTVLRERKGWKAVQRASRADCELLYQSDTHNWSMAKGTKDQILLLFEKFSKYSETI